MGISIEKIERLKSLLAGSLQGEQKITLLVELQNDSELSDYYDLLKQLYQVSPQNSQELFAASKKLSQTLYKDFLKEKSNSQKQFGVQVFDSSLLPLPEGVRPASVDTRQLKYQVGELLVALTVYPTTIDSVELIGQIQDFDKNEKIKIKAKSGRSSQVVEIDEFGLFRFDRIDAGKCSLLFTFENEKEGVIELSL